MGRAMTLLLLAVVAMVGSIGVPASADPRFGDRDDLARDMFERINAERAARGLQPLRWDPALAELASGWSLHMAVTGEYGHRDTAAAHGADGELSRWFSGIGENINTGLGETSIIGWQHVQLMRSDGHRRNILSTGYDAVGIGVHCDSTGRVWITQNFAGQWAHDWNDAEEPWDGPDPPRDPIVADAAGRSCRDGRGGVPRVPLLNREYAVPLAGVTPEIDRLAGRDRVATAAELADAGWPDAADEVVLARVDEHADALAGSALAGAADAPILLTGAGELHPRTAAEIERLDPETVTAVGGTSAISEGVLAAAGELVDAATARAAGEDRFETARVIAEEVETRTATAETTTVMVAEGGDGWPDAVAASAAAAAEATPLLLTRGDELSAAASAFISDHDVARAVLLGGDAVLSDRVADDLDDLDVATERLAGDGRFATAALLRDRARQAGLDPFEPWLVTLADWPDSLTAGPAAAAAGALPYHLDGGNPDVDPSDSYTVIGELIRTPWEHHEPDDLDEVGDPPDLERIRPVGGTAAIDRDTVQEVLARHQLEEAGIR